MFKSMMSLFIAALLSVQLVHAADYKAGTHYEVLPVPVLTRDKNKIEVVEMFWYGCGHCFRFEPVIQKWKKNLPADVDFHQMPGMWNKPMRIHAAAFYTANALGVSDTMHQKIFNAMNIEKKRLASEKAVAELFAANGVDKDKVLKTIGSFGVKSQVNLAESRARSYRMQGTPEIVVNGKYRISASMLPGGQAELLKVADFLIDKERQAMPKAK